MKSLVSATFHRFHDHVHEIDRVLRLCIDGLMSVASSVPLVEALANLDKFEKDDFDSDASARHVDSARRRAEFAQHEIDRGFPILHAHALVAIWGGLEAFVEDLVTVWLSNDASALQSDAWASVKIPFAEFQSLEPEERVRALVREYARQTKADLKSGASRFEVLLGPIGLSGAIDEDVRKTLFEMSQVRNVLVHRAGLVDRRLAEGCPWLGLTVGEPLLVSRAKYDEYLQAVSRYLVELVKRNLIREGRSREEAERMVRPDESQSEDGESGESEADRPTLPDTGADVSWAFEKVEADGAGDSPTTYELEGGAVSRAAPKSCTAFDPFPLCPVSSAPPSFRTVKWSIT